MVEESKAYKVLARKYRPQNFSDLRGQETMVRILKNAFAANRIAHSFILTGIRGTGKRPLHVLLQKDSIVLVKMEKEILQPTHVGNVSIAYPSQMAVILMLLKWMQHLKQVLGI